MVRVAAAELQGVSEADLQPYDPNGPQYGPVSLTAKGALPRKKGDVIDQLASKRGGQLPRRSQAKTDEPMFTDPNLGDTYGGLVAGGAEFAGDTLGSMAALPETIVNTATAIPRSIARGGKELLATGSPSKAFKAAKETPRWSDEAYHDAGARTASEVVGDAASDAGRVTKKVMGTNPKAIVDVPETSARVIPPVLAAVAGGVESLTRKPTVPGSTVDNIPLGEGTDLEGALPRRQKVTPQQVHAEKINNTIGQGSIDSARNMNVGEVLAQNDMPVDVKAVKRDPLTLTRHIDSMIDRENLAADHMLRTPEATAPTVDVTKVLSEPDTALLSSGDVKAAQSVRDYINRRVEELNAVHRNMGQPDLPEDMVSVADMDHIKREIDDRANWDKIFGNNSVASAADVRNGAINHYHGQLDGVGDTIPGYSELNNRRSTLIHTRQNVIGPVVDASVGKIPSRVHGAADVAVGGARVALGNKSGIQQIGRGTAALESNTKPSAVKIAQAMNDAVESNRSEGFRHPVHSILDNTADISLAPQENPNVQGDGFQITRQNVPPSSTDALPMSKPEAYQRESFGKNRGDVQAMADAADAKAPVAGYTPELMDNAVKKNRGDAANEIRGMKKDAQLEGGVPMQTEVKGGRLPRRTAAADRMSPYTDQTEARPGIVEREGLGKKVPRRPRQPHGKTQYTDDRGLDPKILDQMQKGTVEAAPPEHTAEDLNNQYWQQDNSNSRVPRRGPTNIPLTDAELESFREWQNHRDTKAQQEETTAARNQQKLAAAKAEPVEAKPAELTKPSVLVPRRKKTATTPTVESTTTPKAAEKPQSPTATATTAPTTSFDNAEYVMDANGRTYELERIIENSGRISLKLKGQAKSVSPTGFKPTSAPKKK
jgi:hypothetical protein